MLLLLFVVPDIQADQVIVKNGDRLSGTVIRMTRTELRLRTPYAGVLNIAWDQVREVRTDRPLRVTFDDGTEHLAHGIQHGKNKITLTEADNDKAREFEDVVVADISRQSNAPRPAQFFGRVELGLKAERGNGDTDNIDLDLDMTYRKRHQRLRVRGDWELDTAKDLETKRRWSAKGGYSHFFDEKVFGSLWLGFDRDKLADIDLRTTIGPFVGYQFYDSDRLMLLAEVGFVWVNENLDLDLDVEFAQPAWHLNFEKSMFNGALDIYHEQFGIINTRDKWLLDSRTGVRFPISGGFLGSVEIDVAYDSAPATNADTTDTKYRFKLGYRW